jgi:hypothetical protein
VGNDKGHYELCFESVLGSCSHIASDIDVCLLFVEPSHQRRP